MICWQCKVDFPPQMLHGGLCAVCGGAADAAEDEEDEPLPPGHDIWLSTEVAAEGTVRLGLVTGQCVFGMNLLKDIGASQRDIVGGRSKVMERALEDARNQATLDLRLRAAELGAVGVIALRIDHDVVSPGGGTSMVMVTMTGTAVGDRPAATLT